MIEGKEGYSALAQKCDLGFGISVSMFNNSNKYVFWENEY